MDMTSERVCYVHCNFCNTILAVSVPCSSMLNPVTVRCGHCANLLSVNMGSAAAASATSSSSSHAGNYNGSTCSNINNNAPPAPPAAAVHHQPATHHHDLFQRQAAAAAAASSSQHLMMTTNKNSTGSSSSSLPTGQLASKPYNGNNNNAPNYQYHEIHRQQPRTPPPIPPPEKRQRVPSAYNKFIKEEIQRIKTRNPEISHREAFSMAAKNWAHFPHIHHGLNRDGRKQAKLDQTVATRDSVQRSQGFYSHSSGC